MARAEADGAQGGSSTETLAAARAARADRYFRDDLKDQRHWYSRMASANKAWAQRLSFVVIGCGALVTLLQVFEMMSWSSIITATLGAVVALAHGAQHIWRFDETWMAYRTASEKMKRERRLYLNGAGAYAGLTDEGAAYRQFVETIETIIAEEQQIYWETRTSKKEGGT